MGLGWRKGRRYYYAKERIGDRVVSRYMGGGELAYLMAEMDEMQRIYDVQERRRERERMQRLHARQTDDDAVLDEMDAQIRALTEAVLLVNGYHTHKRQWRKQRKRRS